MAHQPFSRPTLIDYTLDTISRRSTDPVYTLKNNNHANNDVDPPDRTSRFDSSSSSPRTDFSRFSSDGSLDGSLDARGHFGGHHAASVYINGTGHQFAASEEEEDGHLAWADFISPPDSLDHISFEQDSSGMVIPGLLDDSALAARGSGIGIDDRSLLNSEYESSFAQPSATASQVLTGVGTAFANHFLVRPLRLTPECRHSSNTPICARCMH
ncbi:hypothetical protein PV04_10036 [Phialophora macrospora]|uniref:Uncharacterized protein n=1 Tax=Phialophora macrospora TaxID=1851006 RepID=A0A0D2F8D2_9EURO|nr:hypothetical protein PV04_10036 [Phialophora macrospora]